MFPSSWGSKILESGSRPNITNSLRKYVQIHSNTVYSLRFWGVHQCELTTPGRPRDDSDRKLDEEIMRALATDGQLWTVDPDAPRNKHTLVERVQARRGTG